MGNQSSYCDYNEYEGDDVGDYFLDRNDRDTSYNRFLFINTMIPWIQTYLCCNGKNLGHMGLMPLIGISISFFMIRYRRYRTFKQLRKVGFYKTKYTNKHLNAFILQKTLFNHNNELLDKKKIIHNISEYM